MPPRWRRLQRYFSHVSHLVIQMPPLFPWAIFRSHSLEDRLLAIALFANLFVFTVSQSASRMIYAVPFLIYMFFISFLVQSLITRNPMSDALMAESVVDEHGRVSVLITFVIVLLMVKKSIASQKSCPVFETGLLLFTGNIPRGVFCEQSSQKTRELRREIMRMHDFCASRSALL